MNPMSTLPSPSPEALAHSIEVAAHIHAEIDRAGGWLPFSRYMELALYAPGLGYYAGGAAKFGGAGDFVTAPELTPLFGRTLARAAAVVLRETAGDILELGAGSGRLALDLLGELERLGRPPARYAILEVSPDLRARQRALFATEAPHLLARLDWLDRLPETHTGLILGNEVLDALPVHLVRWRADGLFERGVVRSETAQGAGFAWRDRPLAGGALFDAARALKPGDDYLSEINLAAPALIASLAATLNHGAMLWFDYGFPRAEYYHPQRHMGTLRMHYRHHCLDDPFWLPGLADITAHVDFSAVAEAGLAAGLDPLGYTSQGGWLLDAGLLDLMAEMEPMTPPYLRAASAVQKLVQPSEMGELFKVLAFGRGLPGPLPGFRRGDRRAAIFPETDGAGA